MAKKTQVLLVDDIDGSEATTTVGFGLDGIEYEIDLSDEHAGEFRDALNEWTGKARRVGGRARRGTSPSAGGDTKKIRQWALENGIQVSDRGRVSVEVREAYAAAH
ncbi:histone-like nucleoid-structuring protein Lsr2 [Brachybacterium kimchii]|uniref:Lsr2 family protein n=1 Tax=Brachybacterium kimchii TaxID=2942909 RepID=A0ABY4NCX2_9MICO|nr:Lsr2 family protein [Brachybacterium kimchii]UQN31777.1 Lsr2 family protein [Brachybacterium kimchii]